MYYEAAGEGAPARTKKRSRGEPAPSYVVWDNRWLVGLELRNHRSHALRLPIEFLGGYG
jgi:hypothetical protein